MLLIFDCDGVVVDSMPLHNEVEAEMYRSFGIDISAQELSKRFAGMSQKDQYRILEEETGHKIPLDLNIDDKKRIFFTERVKAVPYMHETIEALHAVPHCIASSSELPLLTHVLRTVNLYNDFSPHIFSTQMVAKSKPAPDIFLFAAEKMNFQPKDCIVIEDSTAGIEAAQAAGMKAYGYIGGSHCDEGHGERLRTKGAEIIFSDMRQLPGLVEIPRHS